MWESLLLFEEVVNSAHFQNKTFILFLNKLDLFEEKYPKVPLQECFPEYTGTDIEQAKSFIKDKFLEKSPQKPYVHYTCALQTHKVRFVINAVRTMLLEGDINRIFPDNFL